MFISGYYGKENALWAQNEEKAKKCREVDGKGGQVLDLNKYQPCIILTCKILAAEHFTTALHQPKIHQNTIYKGDILQGGAENLLLWLIHSLYTFMHTNYIFATTVQSYLYREIAKL